MKKRARAGDDPRRQAGYTLIDVMVVTLIIGVLAGIGTQQYGKYVARSKRPEAILAFRAIAAQQREHLLTHGLYAGTFDALGFRVEGGERISSTEVQGRRYNYRLIQDDGPRSWYVVATGNIDGDPFLDIIAASNPR
ncbi:MAG: prepilin-type N-terminal cleavage/methylation domain-containing protein [Polyangiales bacterium]|jgi:prepilin-type N-terminal cleavage/methylation domain-containing protein